MRPGFWRAALGVNPVTLSGLSFVLWDVDPEAPEQTSMSVSEQTPAFTRLIQAQAPAELFDVAVWWPVEHDATRVACVITTAAPGKLQAALGVGRDVILPAARDRPGFRGAALLADVVTGQAVSLTAWDSEPAMQAFAQTTAFGFGVARLQPLLTAPLRVWVYELLALA